MQFKLNSPLSKILKSQLVREGKRTMKIKKKLNKLFFIKIKCYQVIAMSVGKLKN